MAMIPEFKARFGVIPGLSDHTMGSTVPVVATALGAKIIEKHFILDRSIGGPDASFSMNEAEFTALVKSVREAEKAVGQISYQLTEKQLKGKQFARSLYVAEDIKKGELITVQNVKSVRPGYGLHPKYLKDVLGKTVNKNLEKGDALKLKNIDYKNSK
jgi:pseudaminic acid synthase